MSRSTACCSGSWVRAAGCGRERRVPRFPATWSARPGQPRSTPSAAGSMRSSARSSPQPDSRWPEGLADMDFSLTDDQESLRTLAADIFGDKAKPERVEAVEATAERFDRDLWRELAGAGLLGIALPEESGGAGLGLVELALVCEQHGRVVSPIPLAWTTTAALAIATHGDRAQVERW